VIKKEVFAYVLSRDCVCAIPCLRMCYPVFAYVLSRKCMCYPVNVCAIPSFILDAFNGILHA